MEVLPAPVVLVEGLFVLHHAAIRERFDLRVYVETPEELQLERRLKRDLEERGYGPEAVRYQWEHHVLPAYREYLLPYRHLCDMHVVNHTGLDRALPVLADHMLERARAHPRECPQWPGKGPCREWRPTPLEGPIPPRPVHGRPCHGPWWN